MAEVTAAVETVETVAEAAAPVLVADGRLNWEKVAMIGCGIVVVAGGAYICKKLIDNRKAKKEAEVNCSEEKEVPEQESK